ncbi:MAG TPA: hypothetical protein VJB64_00915 [Patescibacteria group bacterium]|nr:hypothetical protein [Patescibacteria group bacterium]
MARQPELSPRQQIFDKLEKELTRAKQSLEEEPDDRSFEDLDAILFLARDTAEAIRNYKLRRDLLVQIYAALIKQPIDLGKLDHNWDGQGTQPSLEFSRHLGTIAIAVADRIPTDESAIEHPVTGERVTCTELRSDFRVMGETLGVQQVMQAFAAA